MFILLAKLKYREERKKEIQAWFIRNSIWFYKAGEVIALIVILFLLFT